MQQLLAFSPSKLAYCAKQTARAPINFPSRNELAIKSREEETKKSRIFKLQTLISKVITCPGEQQLMKRFPLRQREYSGWLEVCKCVCVCRIQGSTGAMQPQRKSAAVVANKLPSEIPLRRKQFSPSNAYKSRVW